MNPTISPTTIMIAIEPQLTITSLNVRPASTAERAIGNDRKRSIRPFFKSSTNPTAVSAPPKQIVCTRMPGIRKSV